MIPGLGFLKSGKGIVKTLAVLAVIGGIAYMAWDYRSLASDNAELKGEVKEWRGNAEAWKKATEEQSRKFRRVQEASRKHKERLEQLQDRLAQKERSYRNEVKDDPKARKWESNDLPDPVSDWVRDLAGTTPGTGTGEPRGKSSQGGGQGES